MPDLTTIRLILVGDHVLLRMGLVGMLELDQRFKVVAEADNGQQALEQFEQFGMGFDPAHSPGPRDGHFGLMGMKERLAALNGTLTIQSDLSEGTRIQISIPL